MSVPVPIGGYPRRMLPGAHRPPGPFGRDPAYPYGPRRITLTPVILHVLVEAVLVEVEADPEPAPPHAHAAALLRDPDRAGDRDPSDTLEFPAEFSDPPAETDG